MSVFALEILTPAGSFFKAQASSVTLKGQAGSLGILGRHAPLLARLQPGPIHIKTDGQERVFAAGAGWVEVTRAGVSVLVDSARPADHSAAQVERGGSTTIT